MTADRWPVPFGRVSEEIAADLRSVRHDGRVVEHSLVADLHLEEALISSGQFLGHRPEHQGQE